MKISELFKKNIARPINGVVKADQLDPADKSKGSGLIDGTFGACYISLHAQT
jgi:hypothetical protein